MLRYLGCGVRRFGLFPTEVHQRANWEFLAVVRGKCGPLFADKQQPTLRRQFLWVFPPDHPHGWIGDGTHTCHVVLFHFGTVPPLLGNAARSRGFVGRPITQPDARRLLQIEEELRPHYEQVTEKSLLLFEKALLELSLMALEGIPFERTETKSDLAMRKVEASLTWYSEHMAEQPTQEDVARAVHVSVSQLRRLFWQARQEKPQKSFTRLRLQRAMELLTHSDLKLEALVAKCGFSSSSDFCRVFKQHQKISPDAWRRQQLPPYRESA